MKSVDPSGIRIAVTQGWEHLNLSYEQVMAVRTYQHDGNPEALPPVLAARRTKLIASRTERTGGVTQGGSGGRRKGKSR